MFNGFYGVLYRELNVFRKKAKKQLMAASLSPLLFLIVFGLSLGRDVTVNGIPYITFLIPGLITMASLNQSYSIAQEINISRFYFHVFDEYLIAPVSCIQIVLGEVMYGMFKGLIATVLIFVYALIFHVTLTLTPLFFVSILIHTFLFSSLAVAIAMLIRDHGDQSTVNTFVITPMVFLCGTFFPVDKLPYFLKSIIYTLPLTYSTKVIRASLTGSQVDNLYLLILYLIIMFMFAVCFFFLATWAVRKVEA